MNPTCFRATHLGDEAHSILDATYSYQVPPNCMTYTLAEAQLLATKSQWTRLIVYEVKRLTHSILFHYGLGLFSYAAL